MSTNQNPVGEHISFDEQVVVVTGGGQGLGRAYALEFARRGAAVVVNDVAAEAADAVVAEITESGGRASAAYDSVGTPEGGEAIVGRAVSDFGSVDAIVHNAGSWRNGPLEDMSAQDLDAVLDVHLRGAFFVARPAWKLFQAKGYGRVVLTSSSAGAFGRDLGSNYVCAKAGLIGLAKAMSHEGERHGIKANAILPNAKTALTRRPMDPAYRARMDASLTAILPRRIPEMVTPMVAYLASRQCSVNGEAYAAGCGHFARVFIGETAGWASVPAAPPTAEEVMAHFDEIHSRADYAVPKSIFDDMEWVTKALRAVDAEALVD